MLLCDGSKGAMGARLWPGASEADMERGGCRQRLSWDPTRFLANPSRELRCALVGFRRRERRGYSLTIPGLSVETSGWITRLEEGSARRRRRVYGV